MIFVGGPRHGHDVNVGEKKPDAVQVLDERAETPMSYVDIVSATTYYRYPVDLVSSHPILNTPDKRYRHSVYLHESINQGDPNSMLAALQDAVTRWWFIAHGEVQQLNQDPVVPPPTDHNGGNPQ